MKKELKELMKQFFKIKTINCISIKKEITPNERWVEYKIKFLTLNN